MNKKLIITIDGPAASGKGTIAYLVARKHQLLNLDSGACYRAVAWLALDHNLPIDQEHQQMIVDLIARYPVVFEPNASEGGPKARVLVGDQDVTDLIRTEAVGQVVSIIGTFAPVRQQVTAMQRHLAAQSPHGVVVEGRDTGSVVFPDAQLKFFLTALPEIRAQRRHSEYLERGLQISLDEVYSSLQERDRRDTERAYSALRVAEDAEIIDSSELTIEQVVQRISDKVDHLKVAHDIKH